ncbi:unnamed protein product [Haemonchus placei]|uniref:CUB domain-containing protein n=1 Tax=Haemonchus placei TaxID=6290 RepID=A0A158QK59_HAEPC|nr:unnamed protein product [Haemonchus placei]
MEDNIPKEFFEGLLPSARAQSERERARYRVRYFSHQPNLQSRGSQHILERLFQNRDLNCTNTDGYITWTFKLTDANCSIVLIATCECLGKANRGELVVLQSWIYSCGRETFTAYVTLVCYTPWDPATKSIDLSLFNVTNAQPYSASLGNFTDLHVINVNGSFAYAFTFTNANCSNVEHWVGLTVAGTSEFNYFTNGTVTCVPAETPTSGNENLIEITTTPPPTTTTPTPLVIVPGGALPAAPVVIPYQADYEETAEHVEESVSSFESMSITSL